MVKCVDWRNNQQLVMKNTNQSIVTVQPTVYRVCDYDTKARFSWVVYWRIVKTAQSCVSLQSAIGRSCLL